MALYGQAKPVIGQMELFRIQLTAESRVVNTTTLRGRIAESQILNNSLAAFDVNVRTKVQFAGHESF